MSRITGSEVASLMEAYAAVYVPQELTEEQVWEEVENWVNSLLEEGYDLSEYTWEEMYEAYLSEGGPGPRAGTTPTPQARPYMGPLAAGGGRAAIDKLTSKGVDSRKANAMVVSQGQKNLARPATTTPAAPAARPAARPAAAAPRPAAAAPRPAAAPAASAGGAGKVVPTKPAASAQTGDKAKDMATFASTPANKGLAAAAAEKARIRGTQQTDNPLMKDMKSRLPMNSPSVQAPAVSNLGKGNQSLSQNPNAFKAATPKPVATSAAPEVKATNTIAAAPKLAPVSPRQARLNMEMEYDAYDLVLEYLLSQGHTDTVEEAHYVMMEMDAETIGSICEAAADQSDKQIDKGVKTTYKAQNVLDNQHQGRSRGLSRLPANERAAKTKRMGGRLKSRRDDLFGERNKREDSRRDELKKMLGL